MQYTLNLFSFIQKYTFFFKLLSISILKCIFVIIYN